MNGRNQVAFERLIDRRQNLSRCQLVETAAEASEVTFAAKLLAGQARLRILHHPDVAAMLDRAGGIPRLGKAAHRPGTDQARAGGAVQRYGRTAGGRCEMRGRRIRGPT
jgi:hypothetical protein